MRYGENSYKSHVDSIRINDPLANYGAQLETITVGKQALILSEATGPIGYTHWADGNWPHNQFHSTEPHNTVTTHINITDHSAGLAGPLYVH